MASDPELVEIARGHRAKVVDRFLGSKRIIADSREKQQLGVWGAAVEMESFRVMAAAHGRGIPAVAVRGISDGCDSSLPYDFRRAADREGKLSVKALFGQVVRRPSGIPGLLRLGRQSKLAALRTAEFLNEFVASMAANQAEVAVR
jgi:hypothetical protein